SNIAVYLSELLIESDVEVKIIEKDYNRCLLLADLVPEALIIHGDGSVKETLSSEGLQKTDALITLTNIDEENIILSMYANHLGVPKTITKVNRIEYSEIFQEKGVDSMVSPKLLTASEIVRYVRSIDNNTDNAVLNLYRIANGKAEALEFQVDSTIRNINVPLSQIKLRKGILFVSFSRKGKMIIPNGNDVMKEGDLVVIVTSGSHMIQHLNDIFLD
nr:NAD-binding protein [Proteocatella sp.]